MARAPPAISPIKISLGGAAQVRPVLKNARKITKKKRGGILDLSGASMLLISLITPLVIKQFMIQYFLAIRKVYKSVDMVRWMKACGSGKT
jgi:hypothetical protein